MDRMTVVRVEDEDGDGSHIEPALDPAWSPLRMLQWKAAVVTCDTGVPVTVYTDGQRPGEYGLIIGRSGTAGHRLDAAWTYLNGVVTGAQATREAP